MERSGSDISNNDWNTEKGKKTVPIKDVIGCAKALAFKFFAISFIIFSSSFVIIGLCQRRAVLSFLEIYR